ncbi:MAG TPA: fumarylacetoacetate hydrolase family protein [Stellaceae bacterium]|nr:fumarylacetoacetate hydrolase family protein [Stellaceae bacterium]
MSAAFRLATVSSAGSPRFVALVLGDKSVALNAVLPHVAAAQRAPIPSHTMLGLLGEWERSFEVLSEAAALLGKAGLEDRRWADAVAPMSAVRVHAPIARPPKMFYAAINYPRPDRLPRKDDGIVRRPYMFEKTASCVTGPYDDVVKPEGYDDIDGEVELGVVIGKRGKTIPVDRAMEHVAGFIICNDLTVRNFRAQGELPVPGPDWLGSKCWDHFAPQGPYLVPRQFVPDCRNLRLTLKVNGETRQDGNTRDMIHSPETQVAFMSNQMTLEPGDVISTGTPNGIGIYTGVFIRAGDLIECEIDGLGVQRNRLVAAG